VSDLSPGDEARLLAEGATALGVELGAEPREKLLRYLDRLYFWNRTAGLTTIPREEAVRLHLLDSLAAVPSVERGPCADLGTGGGLPGVVLAIAKADLRVVLVESNRRKCSFLREIVRELGLANAEVVQSDYAALTSLYPTVISRAFRPPAEFLALAGRLVEPGGLVVLLLADASEEEIRRLDDSTSALSHLDHRQLKLPGGPERRSIVRFRAVRGRPVSRET
jgi:16S rRNA (guanine527-N7)-methyltransferase